MAESVRDDPISLDPKEHSDISDNNDTPHVVNEQQKLDQSTTTENDQTTDTDTDEDQPLPENTSTDNSDFSDSSVGASEGLRRRRVNEESEEQEEADDDKGADSSKIGITSTGERFTVPVTKNPLALYPIAQWDFWDWAKNSSAISFVFLLLPLPKSFFIFWFIFWRLGYNLGLGILLHKQSNGEWITRVFEKLCKKDSIYYPVIKKYLSIGMKEDYKFDECPSSFNAWIGFRHIVDIILAFDLVSYTVFCLAYLEWPGLSFNLVFAYLVGAFLCIFTVWAKTDAYRVVKDFAWYWGDFFYLINQKLTFDRVFSLSPHPMYTIGYSFFYGASLISQSYTVLYVSLFGHFCQLAFLSLVENPHIEKTYPSMVQNKDSETSKILYDLKTGYFRKDLIVFKNVDFFRSTDLFLVFILFYVLLLNLLNLHEYFYITQAIVWRCIHSFGLGFILYQQSKKQFWTKHFVKRGYTKQYAFENWKAILNLSIAITHVVFISCAVKMTTFEWNFSGPVLLKQTLGLILIALNIWSSVSTFEVLGDFGWFYGDFFIEEVPSTLYYSGIYRFINNPDSVTGFAGYYGLALLSDSWTIFFLAVLSQAANALFVRYVETPHMRKLYGSTVRDKSGIEQAISEIVNEAVEASPHLKKIKHKAVDLETKAKRESKKLLEEFSKRAKKIKDTAKEKAKIAESNLKFRRTKSVNNFKFLD